MVKRVDPYNVYSDKIEKHDLDVLVKFHSDNYIDKDDNLLMPVRKVCDNFLKWKLYLDELQIPYTVNDYITAFSSKDFFKYSATTGINFSKSKYFMFDYERIKQHITEKAMRKRGSSYDVENIIKKHGITREEAENLVNDRKHKTSGSLDRFIERHGEELGKQKYEEFKEKSKSSLENFIKRFGEEEGKKRWDNYMNTRDSSSKEYWISKLGEEEGRLKFEEVRLEFGKSGRLEYYIEKYGEMEGQKKYDSMIEGKSCTKEKYIEKHGEEKYEEMIRRKTITKKDYIEKYGEEKTKIWSRSKSPLYNEMLKTMSVSEANEIYDQYLENKSEIEEISEKLEKASRSKKSKRVKCVSKPSIIFFELLSSELGRKLQFGSREAEIKLFDKECIRIYYYDCFDKESNTIIEWNGSAFHAPPNLTEEKRKAWTHAYSDSNWDQVKINDDRKIYFANQMGYNTIVVWDFECKLTNIHNTVKRIAEAINETQKEKT